MEEQDIQRALDSYTKSLTHLYRSIVRDKEEFTSLLGTQWCEIPTQEQDSLIDDHFLPPNILRKFPQTASDESDAKIYPHYVVKSGQRIVEDDEGDMWQDEHSGPFSWETGSQSELTFGEEQLESRVKLLKDPKRPKSPKLVRASSSSDIMNGSLDGQTSNFQTLQSLWEAHHLPTGEFYMATRVPAGTRSDSEAPNIEDTPEPIKTDFRSDLKPVAFEAVQPEPAELTPLQQVELRRVELIAKTTPDRELTEKATPDVELRITEPGDGEPADDTRTNGPVCSDNPAPDSSIPTGIRESKPHSSVEPPPSNHGPVSQPTVSHRTPSASRAPVEMTATSNSEGASEAPTEPEVDILAKFGVTFSLSTEKKMTNSFDNPTFSDGEANAEGGAESGTTDKFDFLTDW